MTQIRECRPEDFEPVLELLRQLWPDTDLDVAAMRRVFDRALRSRSNYYVCATDNKKVVGFGSLSVKDNLWQAGLLGHVDELVVDASYRGRGIGARLVRKLIAVASQRGCRRVELDSAFHRKEAHQFYEKQGFENRAYLVSKRCRGACPPAQSKES